MNYVAGIDGGQTATTAAVADENGNVLGVGTGPAADLVGVERTSQRRAQAIDAAIGAALARAGLEGGTRFAAIVAGISGFDSGDAAEPHLETRAERIAIVHDAEIALAGALDGNDGIVVIAGTGSVALGRAGDTRVRAGGWGFLFGDEGSAFAVARAALARAMHDEDRGFAGAIAARALAFFDVKSLRAIQHGFAHGEIDRAKLAAFAREVFALASSGDPDARAVRANAANALGELVRIVDERLGVAPLRRVSHAGGAFADAAFLDVWRRVVTERVPHATIVHSMHPPELGAVRMACTLAGLHPQRIVPIESSAS